MVFTLTVSATSASPTHGATAGPSDQPGPSTTHRAATRPSDQPGPSTTHGAAASPLERLDPATGPTAPAEQAGDVPSPPPRPRWRLPLDGRGKIMRRFDPPVQPWLSGHRGLDLAARPGQVVRAAGPGVVGYAGPLAGRGVVMIIHAEGLRTTYLPVKASVRRGQSVALGDVIGSVEPTAAHCPTACLHWGLLNEIGYLDPLLLIGLGQVRLLPRWRPR